MVSWGICQQHLPILKTNSTTLDVSESGILKKGEWELSQDPEWDVYEVLDKNIRQKLVFYSDIDSLSFSVEPDTVYDFIILLKNKQSFKTRISTRYNTYRKNCNNCAITSDTINFDLDKNKIIIKGKINQGEELEFLFDTGAESIGLYQSGYKKYSSLHFNRPVDIVGIGGISKGTNSAGNQLQLDHLIWDNKSVYYANEQLKGVDGLIGYKIFEDKVVEIDFDKQMIMAHRSLPVLKSGYTACRFEKRGGLYFIELKLKIGEKVISGWFDFDTGNNGVMYLHDGMVSGENIDHLFGNLGEATIRNTDGNTVKTRKIILQKLYVGAYELTDIPVLMVQPNELKSLPFSNMGIELIKRFNIVMDYKNNVVYLKPNRLFNTPFRKKDNPMIYGGGILIGISLLIFIFKKMKARNKSPKKILSTLVTLLLSGAFSNNCAQINQNWIAANSNTVAIKDGEEGLTRYWNLLEPTNHAIVYQLAKNQGTRKVIFYTDKDSISFTVTPNATYPFKVLLNKTDTIKVELSTLMTNYTSLNSATYGMDTIPFTLNKNKQIVIKGSINNSSEIDFVFDLGARITYLIGSNMSVKNKLILDGHMEDESVTGLATEQTSSNNTLRFGTIKVENTSICYIDEAGHLENGYGLIGNNIFEGKILEIDFDKQLLIISSRLPAKVSGYSKLPMKQTTGGLYVPVTIKDGLKEITGWYFFDTGADNELTVDSRFAQKQKFSSALKKIGEAAIASSESRTIKASLLEVPAIKIAGIDLANVPVLFPDESNAEAIFEDGVIGIGLQKRFNLIIDYPQGNMYLKPNGYFGESFKKKEGKSNDVFIFCSLVFILAGGISLFLYLRKKKQSLEHQ